MDLNFLVILAMLGVDAAFRLANQARPAARYLFNTLLPEMTRNSYHIEAASMTVRTTMAGLVAMDSPYPPGGMIETSKFLEQAAKLGIEVSLSEKALRDLQELAMRVQIAGDSPNDRLADEVLNFLQKVIIQSMLDRAEWMRGQALVYGEIDWTFNKKNLKVTYGVPAANFLTHRTGNDAYGGSASKFWDDIRAARALLRYNVRAFIAHSSTIDEIVSNSVNAVQIVSQDLNQVTIRRLISVGGNTVVSSDARDTVTIIAYDEEGEVLDPTNTEQTITIPFMPAGKILAVGNNSRNGYRVGEGSTDDPNADLALGYHHIAPTVEGGGRAGRWAKLFTPEQQPWMLTGMGASNELPVIEAPEKIVILSTAMS